MKTWQLFVRKPIVRRLVLGGAGILIVSTVAVRPAHSQFGIDTAAILAGLEEINSTLSSAVASPLKAINQVEQQEQQFQQNVLYPISAINSAKQMATGFTDLFYELQSAGYAEYLKCYAAEPTATRTANVSPAIPITSPRSTVPTKMSLPPLPAQTAMPQNVAYQVDMGMRKLRTRSRRQSKRCVCRARDGSRHRN